MINLYLDRCTNRNPVLEKSSSSIFLEKCKYDSKGTGHDPICKVLASKLNMQIS